MSEKKTCVACGKQIPSVALVCVFCSAAQPASETAPATTGEGAAPGTSVLEASTHVSSHATDPTLIGLKAADLQAAMAEAAGAGGSGGAPANGTPAATRPTAAIPVVSPEEPGAEPGAEPATAA